MTEGARVNTSIRRSGLDGHIAFVHWPPWSPESQCLGSGGGDAILRLWDVRPAPSVSSAQNEHDSEVRSRVQTERE